MIKKDGTYLVAIPPALRLVIPPWTHSPFSGSIFARETGCVPQWPWPHHTDDTNIVFELCNIFINVKVKGLTYQSLVQMALPRLSSLLFDDATQLSGRGKVEW